MALILLIALVAAWAIGGPIVLRWTWRNCAEPLPLRLLAVVLVAAVWLGPALLVLAFGSTD
jgi:hypothetical protein